MAGIDAPQAPQNAPNVASPQYAYTRRESDVLFIYYLNDQMDRERSIGGHAHLVWMVHLTLMTLHLGIERSFFVPSFSSSTCRASRKVGSDAFCYGGRSDDRSKPSQAGTQR
jgi:hypothetical protein